MNEMGVTGRYRMIDRCRGCHAADGDFESILEMLPMPLAGLFCQTREEASRAPRFPLTWLQCRSCGLVQVGEDIADEHLFEEYNYASSSVPGLVRHFDEYARFLSDRYAGRDIQLLEIGCNDGVLLNRLPATWQVQGVDPSDVASRAAANGARYDFVEAPFSTGLVEEEGWGEKFDIVTGSNCLAHISDLQEVFTGVAKALKPSGWFWVEVHDLAALLEGSQWDTIYHEHKVEWSVEALKTCVERIGFQLELVQRLPLHGGVIRCGFRRSTGNEANPKVERGSAGLGRLREAYKRRHDVPAVRTLLAAQDRGESICAYGASGRANVFLNQVPELEYAFVVDEAPLRVNRFIPVRGTPIVPRGLFLSEQPMHCLVTAWNYRTDIEVKNDAYQGQWLSAFPVL